jgi:hypothetical protein
LIAIFRDYRFLNDENKLSHFKSFNINNYFDNQTVLRFDSPKYSIEYLRGNFKVKANEDEGSFENDFEKTHPIYIPTERILISSLSASLWDFLRSGISLPDNITAFGSYFERATKGNVAMHFGDIVNNPSLVYKYENGLNKIRLGGGQFIKLHESASGIQSLIPLLVVVEHYVTDYISNAGRSFIIEEPELNLFPPAQRNLLRLLIKLCIGRKYKLIITTHSPYLLTTINNLLMAPQSASKTSVEEIDRIIPRSQWIQADSIDAIYIDAGEVKSILDKSTGLISESEIDLASEDILEEFEELMKNYSTQ